MPINCDYSILAQSLKVINNSNHPITTAIEEIPTDIGRSWEGYKRGGLLEGAEKMRKELMTAAVWIAGIPFFNTLGNLFCEKILNIPTKDIDFSDAIKGNDAVLDTAKFLVNGTRKAGLDYSEVEKNFFKNGKLKIDLKGIDAESLAKRIKNAKKVTSIMAVVLNCIMMGVVIPKINQRMTEKKLKEQQKQINKMHDFVSFDDFRKNNKKTSLSFGKNPFNIPTNPSDITYAVENNNRYRLLVTDIPMIIGRMLTSRNKYEALEYLIMDGTSTYFYNFASEHMQILLRHKTIPNTQAITIETLANNPKEFGEGIKKIEKTQGIFDTVCGEKPDVVLKRIFGDEIAQEIYRNETYGKYGKANRYVENDRIKEINRSIQSFIEYLKKQAHKQNVSLFNDNNELNIDFVNDMAKKVKTKNAIFLAIGLGVSILGLSVIIPKMTFGVTKLLTGRNEFTGIANYDDKKDDKKS